MKTNYLKFHLSLPLFLLLLGSILTLATFYLDYRITSEFSLIDQNTDNTKTLEIKKDLYQKLLDKGKDSTASSTQGTVGRSDPFAAIQ